MVARNLTIPRDLRGSMADKLTFVRRDATPCAQVRGEPPWSFLPKLYRKLRSSWFGDQHSAKFCAVANRKPTCTRITHAVNRAPLVQRCRATCRTSRLVYTSRASVSTAKPNNTTSGGYSSIKDANFPIQADFRRIKGNDINPKRAPKRFLPGRSWVILSVLMLPDAS